MFLYSFILDMIIFRFMMIMYISLFRENWGAGRETHIPTLKKLRLVQVLEINNCYLLDLKAHFDDDEMSRNQHRKNPSFMALRKLSYL